MNGWVGKCVFVAYTHGAPYFYNGIKTVSATSVLLGI